MNKVAPITWMWMAFPLVGLVINLVWPRKRSLKVIGIVLLLLTAYLAGFSGLIPLDRAVGLASRILTGQQEGTPDQVLTNLLIGQALAHQGMFQLSLGFTLAVNWPLFSRRRRLTLSHVFVHDVILKPNQRTTRETPNKARQRTAAHSLLSVRALRGHLC